MTTPTSTSACGQVCSLPPEDLQQRIAFIRAEILPRATSRRVDTEGAQFEFPRDDDLAVQLRDLVDFERQCCSSLEWELSEGDDTLTLRVGGLDPASPMLASVMEPPVSSRPLWLNLLRTGGVGLVASFVVFCVVPLGLAAWLGGSVAASLVGLDNPWIIASGALLFGLGGWRWERVRARRGTASVA